ncbi:MAG: hypothetical protein RBG1_1C00001G0161 [candidate division Zixibacteria bacterium RBG-1]|nr:MAG: hypothetical protein RBG1_1C00001G0161 [candidate division Zixibacteria bacterium RBG-1]OGC85403.1 MAG: hypothetical protein A2V73_08805 [candidate division Zixibacteria bacterium RBG_19FT_COMBO_42_43]
MRKFLLLFTLFLIWGVNCTKPTGPISDRGDIVYVITEMYPDGYSRVLFIDTATDSLADSLLLPYDIFGMGVSPDGSILYIGSGPAANRLEIDTKTKAIKYQGPNTGVPTPDGRYLVSPFSSDFFDARTHELVYQADSLTPRFSSPVSAGRHFDPQRKLFYGTLPNRPKGEIGVFDYRRFKLVKIINTQFSVADLVVTHAGDKLYYCLAPFFSGIDLKTNESLPIYRLGGNGISYLGIRPNDEYIYKTDLGGELHPEPIYSGLIGVYSPVFEKPLGSIDTRAVEQESPCFPLRARGLLLTKSHFLQTEKSLYKYLDSLLDLGSRHREQ